MNGDSTSLSGGTRGYRVNRRDCLRWLLASACLPIPVTASATKRPYSELLHETLTAMETGNHANALAPLREALLADRAEPCGILALATLYLHTGSPVRAAREFSRLLKTAPNDTLADWGQRLAALSNGQKAALADIVTTAEENPALDAIPDEIITLLQEYVLLMDGRTGVIQNITAGVEPEEKSLLRLEIAGIAALRGGDTARGEKLLKAFLARPEMQTLAEDRALILPFLENTLTQPGAPTLPTALVLPEPTDTRTVSGSINLQPPRPLPDNVSFVGYEVRGGSGYTATTNYAPFLVEWNSTRYPNGTYTIRAVAYDAAGNELRATERALMVANENAPLSESLTPEQRQSYRARLLALLMPRPTRKAAHIALAEQAVKRGDEDIALHHIESVVAIDPTYHNARESLKQYNRTVIGEPSGIWCGVTTEKLVALTFDDGPHPTRTAPLLDALKAADVPATFFVVGIRAEASPDLMQRIHQEGHELANHSYSHPNLTYLPRTSIEKELCRTSCIIRDLTGKRARFYRPPGGNANRMVTESAQLLGMSGAFWTLDGLKFEHEPFTATHLTRYVLDKMRPGAIVLLHNAPENTVAAVPDIVRGLKARGYTLVTMSELVKRCRPGTATNAKVKPHEMKE